MAGRYEYHVLPVGDGDGDEPQRRSSNQRLPTRRMAYASLAVLLFVAAGFLVANTKASAAAADNSSCDTVLHGYQCAADISPYWGQYSPYFSVPSSLSDAVPDGCSITFAQMLSRHGARDPTESKTALYNATINKIHAAVSSYPAKYAFLERFAYTLGADQLTTFGQRQMANSGQKFYLRYKQLAQHHDPFVRSSGQPRVVDSATNWTAAFYDARGDRNASLTPAVIIPEDDGFNNTLSHGLCTAFEEGPLSEMGDQAQAEWNAIWLPAVQARLNRDLRGANLSLDETIYMMDLCPFDTVADNADADAVSPFCDLFTAHEWRQYDYYQSLGKYYGYGPGNPLGPTNGVGFANELVARLTGAPVADATSSNRTLDADPAAFPTGPAHPLFADFSHDNDMTAILAALGLFNASATAPLSNSSRDPAPAAGGYAASWTVPFAARVYVEKMQCEGQDDELVRVVLNDRVVPLERCGADALGRCCVGAFVDSLGFAAGGGDWGACFE